MPPTGHLTNQESSTIAKLPLTTELPLSVLLMHTGELKIRGELLGESLDLSDLLEEIHAVSAMLPHIPTNDLIII